MHVLAIEPYYSGSHRSFLDAVASRSRHHWTLLTGHGRHWKWRMRNAPLEIAQQLATMVSDVGGDAVAFDVVFCSEMLDLPQWRGFLSRPGTLADGIRGETARVTRDVASLPAVTYFHENQWTYPKSPHARSDAHYGYTNLMTALASDEVWFNSQFHRREFLSESRKFVSRMPDGAASHDLASLERRSHVIVPGFEPVDCSLRPTSNATEAALRIGWVGRWEHDKRPDLFLDLLETLARRSVDFKLVLLGPRSKQNPPDALQQIERQFGDRILHNGFASTLAGYHDLLRQIDVVVSTADHEFFGIAICEAISAGAIPLLPDRLSYPELVDQSFLYQTIEGAAEKIGCLQDQWERDGLVRQCKARLSAFHMDATVDAIDERFNGLLNSDSEV